jgi:diguanylate cyclase (GGDEF)-like protein/PAS domain S-box-containing protein
MRPIGFNSCHCYGLADTGRRGTRVALSLRTASFAMKSLPILARVYVALVIVAACALLSAFAALPEPSEVHVFTGLAAAAIAAAVLKLRFPVWRDRAMSGSFVVDFASMLLLGPHKAMLLAAIGAVSQSTLRTTRRSPIYQIVFNVASVVVTVQIAGAVYRLAGGGFAPLNWQDVVPVMATVTTFFLVNSAAVAAAIGLSTHQPIRGVWHENFLWGGFTFFCGAVVSVLIAQLSATRFWDFMPLLAVPVYVAYRASAVFADRLEEESRHREVIESLSEGMAVVQSDGHIALWNDALERIMAVPRGHALGRTLSEAVPELTATALPKAIAAVLETGKSERIEHLALHRDGRRLILEVRVLVFLNGVTIFWNDITDRAEAEAALKHSEERYALAAAGSNDGLWDWDLVSGGIYLSPRWYQMLGRPQEVSCDRPVAWFDRVHPEDLSSLQASLNAHIAGETAHFEHEYRVRHEDGTYRRVLCRGAAVRQDDGKATRIAGSQTDITERAAIQEQLRHAALHDALTGLPNRSLFMELLGQVLDRSKRHPEHIFAVLFLDIDRFKVVNDSLGHLVGDELLMTVSRRLEACMREGDAIARLGGDEFTILLNDLGNVAQASAIAERILQTLRDSVPVKGGREVFVTGSIGIALSASGYSKPEDIMRDADTAMYRAKALGKARYELFDASMHQRAVERLRLEGDLRRAIERGEFQLHYQPIVALKSGQWTGFEALLRWQRDGQQMSPAEFIPIVEEMGMIDLLGKWVIQEACRQVAAWRARFPDVGVLGVTVNVSARQLTRSDFVQTVRDAVWAANLRSGDLRVEITETTLMENPDVAETALRQLRALGVKVYLDDFGTGFSSLSYLHRFPVDTLKIDQSFIASLSGGKHQPAFVESIVALAKTIGTHVIAEGVETEAQMDELMRLGCGEAQGFFFARPLPPHTAERFLEQSQLASTATASIGAGRQPASSTMTH